jgi:hypothetical protein
LEQRTILLNAFLLLAAIAGRFLPLPAGVANQFGQTFWRN